MLNLEDCRRFYAEEVQLAAGITSSALIDAFAKVPREKFLGPGPWTLVSADFVTSSVKYSSTSDDDPRRIYHNVLVALDRSLDLTNGQPGSLAYWINLLELAPGNRVYHLGSGAGYYTAIMAEVVGSSGSVLASEVHPELGPRAKQNLADWSNVTVHTGDGMTTDPGESDAMLINAGMTHPLPIWLDRLKVGGRLVLPITMPFRPRLGQGIMLKITRHPSGYAAQMAGPVGIYSATSGRDPKTEAAIGQAFANGKLIKVKSVRRDVHEPADTCAVHGNTVCLSLAEL